MRQHSARADFGFVAQPGRRERREYFRARHLPAAIEATARKLRTLKDEARALGLKLPEGVDA